MQHGSSDIAALVGNGLSIACNPDLAITAINEELILRLNRAGQAGGTPAQWLQRAAANIDTGDPKRNFEQLLGPIDQYRDGLSMLSEVAKHLGDLAPETLDAFITAGDFVSKLRRLGLSIALEIIAEQSVAHTETRWKLEGFVSAVVASSGASGRVTFGNLNYDSLLMAVLVDHFTDVLCDMTDARISSQRHPVHADFDLRGRPLRVKVDDFPSSRPVTLLHLHGSLAWLRAPGKDAAVHRFDIGQLRAVNYWQAWREGRSDWTPEVVLTNQKNKATAVSHYPFNLGYEVFMQRLLSADRWLIAGYSFGDECVNDLLALAWRARTNKPNVLLVTKGTMPGRQDVLEALQWTLEDPHPATWLFIHTDGIENAAGSQAWQAWNRIALRHAS